MANKCSNSALSVEVKRKEKKLILIWDTKNCLKFVKLVLHTAAKPLCQEEKRNYFNVNRTNGTASFNGIADQSIGFPTKRILLSTLNK